MSDIATQAAPATPAANTTAAPGGEAQTTSAKAAASAHTTTPTTSKAAASATETKAAPEVFDVPIDGKIVKMTREELIRNASLGKNAYSKFEEGAKLRKDAETKLGKLKTPKDVIKFLNDPANGYNKEEAKAAFEEWYHEDFIAPESMTPEQKRIAQLEREKADALKWKEERERNDKETEEKKLDEAYNQTLQKELKELIDESGLPKTKFTAARMAYWLRVNEAKGIQAPKSLIIQQVKKEAGDVVKSLVSATAGDAAKMIEVLGEDVVRAIRKYDIAQMRARRNGTIPNNTPNEIAPTEPKDSKPKMIRPDEVRRRARELYR